MTSGRGTGGWRLPLLAAAMAGLLAAGEARADDELVKAGTVIIEQVQIAFIGSGNLGGGTLNYQGQSYEFTIGGLGIGGYGISSMKATGEVYNMKNLAEFPGAYGAARYGAVAGDIDTGELWLQNPSGVVIHLKTEREGLALSLGADAIYIQMD